MYEIAITDLQDIIEPDTSMFRNVALKTLSEEGVASAVVSIVLVNDETIRDLNRKYLNHDYDTDVLSFLLECDDSVENNEDSQDTPHPNSRGFGKRFEGEVIISTETAAQAAAEFGWSHQDETVLYLVHGLLHLVGYDDQSELEKRLMRTREREILHLFNLVPRYDNSEDSETVSEKTVSIDELSGEDS